MGLYKEIFRIRDETISRAFPELEKTEVDLYWINSPDAFFEYGQNLTSKQFYIKIDKSMKKVREIVFVGGLAHELAHISIDLSLNMYTRILDRWLYKRWPQYQTSDERRTDKLVIERGLGYELLAFVEYVDERYEDYTAKDGLTGEEIKKMLTSRS